MSQDHIIDIEIIDVHKRLYPSKHYVYELKVKWSNNKTYYIYRRYSEFFDFQDKLLNRFENIDVYKHERVLPYLPGKIIFGRSHIKSVALERSKPIENYCKSLISLPPNYSRCNLVIEFFRVNDDDVKFFSNKDDPSNNSGIDGNKLNDITISAPLTLKEYYFIHDYRYNEELTFNKLTYVKLINKYLTGWAYVQYKNQNYFVPYNHLMSVDPVEMSNDRVKLPEPEENVVIEHYKASTVDEVSLEKGTRVKVFEKGYDGWWKVESLGRTGYAPSICLTIASGSNNLTPSPSNVSYACAAHPQKSSKPGRPPPPKPKTIETMQPTPFQQNTQTPRQSITSIQSSTSNNQFQKNLNELYYADETYNSPTTSGVNLVKGQKVYVTAVLNSEQYLVRLENGQTGVVLKHYLVKADENGRMPII